MAELKAIKQGQGWDARLNVAALVLNGFAVVVVNYWIYRALVWFTVEYGAEYGRPATISRAISAEEIGVPFAFWITVSSLCLVVGVGLLALHFLRLIHVMPRPTRYVRLCCLVLMPAIFLLQASSSLGMHWLSVFRMPLAAEMHMTGSYIFFASQAFVVLLFTLFNHALIRDPQSLEALDHGRWVSPKMVRLRFWLGVLSFALILAYFALFLLKDIYTSDVAPGLYLLYTRTEPVVISSFLLLLASCHFDLFRRPN